MTDKFAERMSKIPRSFVREILKVTEEPDIISFAGGLPNPASFPQKELAEVAYQVINESGGEALQYSTTEGYLPLRAYISQKYREKGLKIAAAEILITNGSQQGLDLVGKVFIDKEDSLMVERPTYLAAIQAFGLYEPNFISVPLQDDGVDLTALKNVLEQQKVKMFYCIPSFQNPTGITYSANKRIEVAKILENHDTILVEDNPYGEIRFIGEDSPPIKKYLNNSVLLGSFSKIVSPGVRLGWIVAGEDVMHNLIIAKQASDLHSNYLAQRIVHRYLTQYDVDEHLQEIREMYKNQRNLMVTAIEKYFPAGVNFTRPEGGMFLWVTLPDGLSSMELFKIAIKEKVAFVPGEAFYTENPEKNTLRLNFSNSDEYKIEEGIRRLGDSIKKLMN